MTIALRFALRRSPDAEVGAVVTTAAGLAVAVGFLAFDLPHGLHLGALALFGLAGLLAPGGSQLLFTLAVRDAGPSRTSVTVGTAPLLAVVLAILLLGEPLRLPLVLGTLAVVGGGIVLMLERVRPAHFRAIGVLFALAGAWLIAARDTFVRWAAHGTSVPAIAGACTALGAGVLLMLAWLVLSRRRLPSVRGTGIFVPGGVLFGLSYVSLFEAYYRGRISIVSPLVATEALWAVGLSALLIRSDLVGRRLVAGAALVVTGSVLIGVFR